MKIALKYGSAVALIIAAWVSLKQFALHLEGPEALLTDITVFNLTAILALGLGIRERRIANRDRMTFLQGLGTGVSIAVTYSVLTSLYLAVLISIVGPKLMHEPGDTNFVRVFFGLSIGYALLGTIFATMISLVLRR